MKTIVVMFLVSFLGISAECQERWSGTFLDQRVARFAIENGTFFEGVSQLSRAGVKLHIGLESIAEPKERMPRFTFVLENVSVREILNALCKWDSRYQWVVTGKTINIFPMAVSGNPEYFLNRTIPEIHLDQIPNSYEALTPLARTFPTEQIGYASAGGDPTYPSPWTVTLKEMTVREYINRICEHMGDHTSWVWSGSKDWKSFGFVKGGFK